ncbi:MAG: trypsin-like peptidase domain-containing protein [Chloroflexi bacterium]|nr:trypsin-like peptidase domain-containing protein [Chloroflexota bacterium]
MSDEVLVTRIAPSVVTIRTILAEGSGFVVGDGHTIATNAHVIAGARDVAVRFIDGQEFMATVARIDERRDVALLRVRHRTTPLPLRADDPPTGESVLAFGSPRGLQQTVTRGIVSGLRISGDVVKDVNYERDVRLVQTDAAINPGNSGGPLVDKAGQVVGVNTFKVRGEGVGFAISASEIARLIDERAKGVD